MIRREERVAEIVAVAGKVTGVAQDPVSGPQARDARQAAIGEGVVAREFRGDKVRGIVELPQVPGNIEGGDFLARVERVGEQARHVALALGGLEQIPAADDAPQREVGDDEGLRALEGAGQLAAAGCFAGHGWRSLLQAGAMLAASKLLPNQNRHARVAPTWRGSARFS